MATRPWYLVGFLFAFYLGFFGFWQARECAVFCTQATVEQKQAIGWIVHAPVHEGTEIVNGMNGSAHLGGGCTQRHAWGFSNRKNSR